VLISFLLAWHFSNVDTALSWMFTCLAGTFFTMALMHGTFAVRSAMAVPTEFALVPNEAHRWWHFALPWTIIALCTDYFFDLDLVFLSFIIDHGSIAIFGIVTRIFMLISFGVSAAYSISLPEFFSVDAQKDPVRFLKLIGASNRNAFILAILFYVCILIVGPFFLKIFGPGFARGFWPLTLICLGLVIRTGFGPAALVMSIHNRPYAALPPVAFGIVTLLAVNLWLVPSYGLNGAAIAALLAILAWSAALWITCFRLTGLDVSILHNLRKT
jgi:O-antigen/teichoic acid export membrane protein